MNKRNLLVLVCIMLIAVLTLVSCGGKDNNEPEHEHTYNTSVYVSDATHHWYGASCEHSDLKVQVEAHADANKDGVCDKCEYVTCTHEYADEWTSDENNHWHASTCGCEVIADKSAHADSNKDGKCDVCEYVTCTHTFAENYSSDENGHWLAYTCECELEPAVEDHVDTDKNGICDTCSYVTCAHNPESAWTSDVHTHWHATDCGCEVKIDEAAHIDENRDGACDVCEYVCDHPEKTEWSGDENGHWHDPQCDHEVVVTVVPHEDINKDGACDACGYEDPSHEHAFVVAYNANQHYKVSNCGHFIAKDFENHSDSDENGVCDECNAYVAGLLEIVDSTTSDEAALKVNGATVSKVTGTSDDPWVENNSVSFGKDYTILHTSYADDYLSTYVGRDGQPSLFYITVYREDGIKEVHFYETDVALMKGIALDLLYSFEAVGTEAYVYGLYDYAQQNKDSVYAYTESYDATAGVYSFSYVYENVAWDESVTIRNISVEVTVVDGAIAKVVATATTYESDADYSLDKANNVLFIYNDNPSEKQVVTIEQTVGARSEDPNPHKAEDYLIAELVIYNQATGEQIKEGDVVEIKVGADNALLITVPEADVERINYNNIYFDTGDNWDIIASAWNYPFSIYTMDDAGEYPITVSSTLGGSINFTVKVNHVAPNSLSAAVVKDDEKIEASSVETYAGVPVVIGAIADSSAGSTAVTATVTTGDPDAVTLTAEGNNWIVSSSEIGTYTITLTSTMAPDVKTSISLVVVDAPMPGELLKGNYALTTDYGVTMSVKFTPEYEGAISGTVEIEFDDGMYYGRVIISEKAAYSFAAGQIVLTHVEGDGIAQLALVITPAYEVALRFYPSPEYDPEYFFEFVLEKAPDDPVVVEPNGTTEAPYILTESTTIDLNLAEGEIVYYLFTPSSNGTAGFSIVGDFEDYSVNWGTFNFMILDSSLWNPTTTFAVTKDIPVYIGISTWSGDAGNYSVDFTFEGETPAGPTLESLAGTWEGTESGSTIMAGQVFDLTLNINANGTGTGSSSMLGSFNIVSVEIEGETIVVTTDAPTNSNVLNLVLADGKLTLASGQGLVYTSVVELTKKASSGDEGGDSGDGTAPTLEELAGEWTGEENYRGSIASYIVTVNADGTGSGSYSMDYGPGGIFITTFDITAITIDGATVTFSTITTGEYSGTEQDVVFTYADGALTTDKGLMWGSLTLTPGSSDSGNTETPEGTATVGGASYDYATVLELADANYVTTIAAGEKAYFAFEHDYASMTAVYEITFVVTSGDCTLYSVTCNIAGENATPLPMNYCISSIDANNWRAVIAIENTTDAEVTYAIEVTYVTAQA